MGRCPHCSRRVIPLRLKYAAGFQGTPIKCPGCGSTSQLPPWSIGLALPVIGAVLLSPLLRSRTTAYAVVLGTILTCLVLWAALPLARQS
jgi:hypothetical protein